MSKVAIFEGIPQEACSFPLSPEQRRLYFLERLEPGTARFNVTWAAEAEGDIDLTALESSLAALVRRHEALRTVFRLGDDGEPEQWVLPHVDLRLRVKDLQDVKDPAAARSCEAEHAGHPFDLAGGPLIRALWLRLPSADGRTRGRLLLTIHHLVTDGWSMQILVRELGRLYEEHGRRPSLEPGLPEEPRLQYGDYADWCRQREDADDPLLRDRRRRDLDYWRRRLAGASAAVDLPTLVPPGDRSDLTVDAVRRDLPQRLVDALKASSRRRGATLFTTLFGAYAVLLHRLSGREDLTLGTVTSGRDRAELDGVVGFFVRTLALRLRVDPHQTFDQLLARLRAELAEDLLHEELPFEKVVEALEPDRDAAAARGFLAQNPLFETVFVLQDEMPAQELAGGGHLRWSIRPAAAAQFDWLAQVEPRSDGSMVLALEFRTGAFDRLTMERLADRYQVLLAALAAEGGVPTPVGLLPILPREERRLLLQEWVVSDGDDPGDDPFPVHLVAVAGRRPHGIALAASSSAGSSEAISYGELARRVAVIGQSLRRRGVRPDTVVGLYMKRSPGAVVAMLGIQRAGGAFLPIDPTYPEARVAFMLADAGVRLVVTTSEAAGSLPRTDFEVVLLDELLAEAPGSQAAPVPAWLEPGHLAYVIFTSGSTGTPKGVAVSHRGLAPMASAFASLFALDEGARVLQFSSLSFDASVAEIFSALFAGATICFGGPDEMLPGPELVGLVRRLGVSHLVMVPSALAAVGDPDRLPLRSIVLGGEACPSELALRWSAGRRLVNGYGPTEATVIVSAEVIESARLDPRRGPSIGVTLARHRLFVADRLLQPSPIGVFGQLMIGGPALARGYLRRPGLTAERFTPDPLGGEPGGRLYATGDVVRRLDDGRLEFVGRIDHQVKVRGFRIELGEIESALAAHPSLAHAVVVARTDMGPLPALAAYVVAKDPAAPPTDGELKEHLARRLPDHMIPSHFVALAELPRLPSGKADRKALPRPAQGSTTAPGEAPRTEKERVVVEAWSEVLGRGGWRREDHFFAAGGHSLLAARVMARLSARLGVELPVRRIFEHPTVAGLAAALDQTLEPGGRPSSGAPPIPRADLDAAACPLSFGQERLWFLDRLDPGGSVYNVPFAVDLTGPLDREALAGSLALLVERHESLRTSFLTVDGAPRQRIHLPEEVLPLVLPVEEVGASSGGADLEKLLARRTEVEVRRPFHLDRPPLLRGRLLRISGEHHRLVLTVHHIVSDGVSVEVLLDELRRAYAALTAGLVPRLEPPGIRPRDVAAWQRRQLDESHAQSELDHWRQALRDASRVLDLPTDRPRPKAQTFAGAALPVAFDRARLSSFADACDATPFLVLLATWGAFLGRLTGARELLIGSPVAGRERPELESVVGFLVNTLVLRIDLGPAGARPPSLRQLVGRAKETVLEALAHSGLPFEHLVAALEPERDLARSPLFQVMLAYHTRTAPDTEVAGLRFRVVVVPPWTAKFELTLSVDDSCTGFLEYNTDLFDRTTVEHWRRSLHCFLDAGLDRPDDPVRALPLLSVDAYHLQMVAWNDTEVLARDGRCLHELVLAQAARTPDAVAVVTEECQLTYGELALAVGHSALRLRELGVGSEVLVAVFLERRAQLPIALLAILAAGGAYLPLDPEAPAERTAFLLADAGAALVLTESSLRDRLPPAALPVVELDRWTDSPRVGDPSPLPPAEAAHTHLAYLIYTSGSTGTPKAVAIEHRSAVALLNWAQRWYSREELAGTLAATSITFDLSVFEIFLPLSVGGRLILAADALHLRDHRAAGLVTLVNTVPSAVAELLRLGALPASVRTVNLAGEPLKRALVERIFAVPTVEAVYNLYGPSEDTTYTTWARLSRDEDRQPSIGRPLAGTRIHLLDPFLEPVPVAVAGEILVGGDGLARGYLGRGRLTAERFVPDPFSGSFGARLYRTGDLARYRPDGRIDFLGRMDFQVKIRGFRIELGEIEAALVRSETLREAVVMAVDAPAQDDAVAEKQLAAWIVPADGAVDEEGLVAGLREQLRRELPLYMVPAAFVVLDALPRTASGKLDRKRLPPPARAAGTAPATGASRASSPLERHVAAVFTELLGLEGPPAADQSFFALGGHSLRAVRVVARLNAAFGLDLPLRAIFEAPTVADLAARLDAALLGAGAALPDLPLAPLPAGEEPPLSFAQERLWVLEQMRPGSAVYNVPWLLELEGPLDTRALGHSLQDVVTRHQVLRTRFAAGPRLELADSLPVHLPLVEVSGDEEARRLAEQEIRRPFRLDGPLLRTLLLRISPERHLWVLTLHHAVVDGWSWDVMVAELQELYTARVEGRPPHLPVLPVQYADFAAWQRRRLAASDPGSGRSRLETHLDYWRERLAGVDTFLELPTDHPRPAVTSEQGGTAARDLSPALLERLEGAHWSEEGTTSFMKLLTVFGVLLGRYTGRDDFLVGAPAANRRRRELENLIGFFADTLVLRLDLRGSGGREPTFSEALRTLRSEVLAAFAHQDVPFERLVEELERRRDLSRDPLVQVVFSSAHQPRYFTLGPQLAATSIEPDTGTAKFDLTLHVLHSDRPRLVAHYRSALFDAVTIERMLDGFVNLLRAVAEDAGRAVGDLPLLDGAAREQLRALATVPSPRLEAPDGGRDVVSHFRAQAACRPQAPALAWSSEGTFRSLTWAGLDERSDRLARHLRRLGVAPETPVGVVLERSPLQVTVLLAVLKAGGYYVPFDADDPPWRLERLITDAAVRVVVTSSGATARAPIPDGVETVVLNRGEELDPETWKDDVRDAEPPLPEIDPQQVAYMLYTSGSTGRPKGVLVPHHAVVRTAVQPTYLVAPPGSASTFLYASPLSFDASTWEIWGALLTGARLAVAPPGRLGLDELAATIEFLGVDTLFLTAGLFQPFAEAHAGSLRGVRHLLSGGDVVSPGHCKRLLQELPGITLYDLYGPTENTVLTTAHAMAEAGSVTAPVSIGSPVGHTSVHVVDRRLRPLPLGVPGELVTGGLGLARGYHGRGALTADRFVPDPFAGRPGGRLYKTGDLVRKGADGRSTFLGRLDVQVKVRGFRIEPGEIESALESHPAVSQAVVVAYGSDAGDKRLVAFVVCSQPAGDQDLRVFLEDRVPRHMVPSAVVVLDTMPVTPNGKPDRAALPEPDWRQLGGVDTLPSPPRTPVEAAVAEIWSDVLELDRKVGVREDFFVVGGHSLLAARMVSRIRALFDVALPLQAIFEAPTVEGLARRIEAARSGSPPPPAPRPMLRPAGGSPLSFVQRRLWFLDRLQPGDPSYHVAGGFRLRGSLRPAALHAALIALERRHEALRTRFRAGSPDPLQVVLPPSCADERWLPVYDLRRLDPSARERELARVGAAVAATPFDLHCGPVWRYGVARLSGDEHVLLLAIHHIVCDGWSLSVLLAELDLLYRRAVLVDPLAALERELPPLPLQYPDFAAWQRQVFEPSTLAEQLAYWRRTLAGVGTLRLLTDGWPERATETAGGEEVRRLPAELTRALRALAANERSTLFMVLLAALTAVLSRWTQQDDLVIGSPLAGRDHLATEGVVGCFLDTLALRTDLSGGPSFRELLGRVREAALGAYAHRAVPFDKLVEELAPERSLARHPFFDVLLNMVNVPPIQPRLGDLEVQTIDAGEPVSKLWMTLYAEEKADSLELRVVYRRALFDGRRMAELLAQLEGLLGQASSDPDRSIREYTLITAAGRARLADPTAPLASAAQSSVAATVARWAALHPNLTALRQRGEERSYRRLWDDVAGLGHRLRTAGLRPGDTVGVSGGRSFELVGAVLAVLAAGGVLLTIDPKLPVQRRRRMLELSQARFLFLADGAEEELALTEGLELAILSAAPAAGPAADDLPGLAAPSHGQPAYVFFTSGSTGTPKGVLGRAAGLSHFLAWQRETFNVGPGDRAAQLTGLSFDVVLRDMLMPLTAGATLVMPDDEALAGRSFMDWLRRERVTLLHTVPSLARVWLGAEGEPGVERSLPSLRTAFFAGEPLTDDLVRAWQRTFGGEVVNLYGPTETTLAKCCFRVGPEPVPGVQPVGWPLPGTQALVLDGDRLCGLCEPGEIVLRTPYRSLGYLDASGEDEARFILNPFVDGDEEDVVYRTGDLGAFRPDGSLAILGRLDDQVKIRGVRVVPGEIQSLVEGHPGVAAAVAVARADDGGATRLVVYFVATDPERPPMPAELRGHLASHLPDALVPATFIRLGAMPLTATGKVDRSALPAPDEDPAGPASRVLTLASSELERRIAELWKSLLGVDRLGVDESFFDLGGHSLLLLEMQTRLEEWLDRPLPMVELFRHPTIASLARWLDGGGGHLDPPAERPASDAQTGRAAGRLQLAARGRRRSGGPSSAKRPGPEGRH